VEVVNDRPVVDRIPPDVEKERSSFSKRSAQVAAIFFELERRFFRRVGIARIPDIVTVVEECRSAKFIGPGLGEDLDAAVSERVEFRCKRIGIDADFANGLLGRQLAAAEPVDVNLAAIGTRGRAS